MNRLLKYRVYLIVVTATIILAVGGYFVAPPVMGRVQSGLDDACVRLGLQVHNMYISGTERVQAAEVEQIATLEQGQCIFSVPLQEIKQELETLPWVQAAVVERKLPDSIYVYILEHTPFMLWQNQGEVALINREGRVITLAVPSDLAQLPLLVGDDAAGLIEEVVALFNANPELSARISSVIRVSKRRWNIRTKDKVEIKLPEIEPVLAWRYVASVHEEKQLLDRAIKSIDVRVPGKMYIEPR